MRNKHIAIGILIFTAIGLVQCKKDTPEPDPIKVSNPTTAITDDELFNMSNTTTGYTYYKNNQDAIESSPESAHNAFFKVRFNSTAQAALTDNGKLPSGGTFPEGSIIVKELHKAGDGSDQNGIAVMIKRKDDPNATEGGWVWGEYFGSTANAISVSTKGAQCKGCHNASGNRDKVRLFTLFP